MKFVKKCPKCGKTQKYKSKRNLEKCIARNTSCRSCAFINPKLLKKLPRKFCSKCGKEQKYCSKKILLRALENKTICKQCVSKLAGSISGKKHKGQKRDPKIGKKISQTKRNQDHTEFNNKREQTNLERYGSLLPIGLNYGFNQQILLDDSKLSLNIIENLSKFFGVDYVTG
jgi:hypothetical protein